MFRHDSPASAMETGGGKEETLDEFKRKKMMRRTEKLVTGLGFFTLTRRVLFISTHQWAFTKVWSNILLQALICCLTQTIKESSTYQGKRCVQEKGEKKGQGIRKYP
jgi:hypothetical protein